MSENTQLSKKTEKLRTLLESPKLRDQMALVLPKHLTPDRMARIAITALIKTPKLAECDPASVLAAMMTCSQHGIEPDGRRAHLIPFGSTCQLIIDYKGLVELMLNDENVGSIYAKEVRENDEFDYNKGVLNTHRFSLGTKRGEIVGAYCLITFKDGTEKCEVMDLDELIAVRNCSKAKDSGPYVQFTAEMYKKIVIKRASKQMQLSPSVRDAIEADDNQFQFNREIKKAKPIFGDSKPVIEEEQKVEEVVAK